MQAARRWLTLTLLLAAAVFATPDSGSAQNNAREDGIVDAVAGDVERDTQPDVTPAQLAELVAGNSDFAFDLYRAVAGDDENLFFSPYSISAALAMTYAGARGDTEAEMANTLHYTLAQDELHPAFNLLDLVLESRGRGARGRDEEGFRLNIANSVWGQQDHPFLPAYLELLAANYGAGLKLVDFRAMPEECRELINAWVSDETEEKIEELIPPGLIDEDTRLVLTNAIYFNAGWAHTFNDAITEDGDFHLPGGDTVTVPMMRQTERFRYAEMEGVQAVELPYDGYEMSMLILLPAEDGLADLEQSLSAERIGEIAAELDGRTVQLTMPRFEFSSKLMLAETLAAMGMPEAFTARADFSGMDGRQYLAISEVVHEAFVSVDEEGTEAAAATAVIIAPGSAAPEEPVELTLDRPFVFLILDNETGAILFVGRVFNPAPQEDTAAAP